MAELLRKKNTLYKDQRTGQERKVCTAWLLKDIYPMPALSAPSNE